MLQTRIASKEDATPRWKCSVRLRRGAAKASPAAANSCTIFWCSSGETSFIGKLLCSRAADTYRWAAALKSPMPRPRRKFAASVARERIARTEKIRDKVGRGREGVAKHDFTF